MKATVFFSQTLLIALILFGSVNESWAQDKPDCFKTYFIKPSGVKLDAKIFKKDLSLGQLANIRDGERIKYNGSGYRSTGEPANNRENCAGYVMRYLFPGQFKQGVIDKDDFYNKIVKPYGSKRLRGTLTVSAGDVVVYTDNNGGPAHIALVMSADRTGIEIRSKDNNESPMIGTVPRSWNWTTNDPLIRNYPGTVEFWQIDKTKFSIQEVSSGDCNPQMDISGRVGTPGQWVGTWVMPYHGGKATLTINAGGSGTSEALGTELTNGQPNRERGALSQCTVEGQSLKCHWQSTYSDGDKTITRAGEIVFTVSGDKLICSGTVDPKSIQKQWRVKEYDSGAYHGGTSTYTRVK